MKVVTAEGKIIEATPISDAEAVAVEALTSGIHHDNGIYITSREKDSVISCILKNFKIELRNPPTPESAKAEEVDFAGALARIDESELVVA